MTQLFERGMVELEDPVTGEIIAPDRALEAEDIFFASLLQSRRRGMGAAPPRRATDSASVASTASVPAPAPTRRRLEPNVAAADLRRDSRSGAGV